MIEGGLASQVDEQALRFAACHSIVLVSQVDRLLGVPEREAAERLRSLRAEGLISLGPRLRH